MEITREVSAAIYVAFKHLGWEPINYKARRYGAARYYAFRVLIRHFVEIGVQVPAPILARAVGYSEDKSQTIGDLSNDNQKHFDRHALNCIYAKFQNKLQINARQAGWEQQAQQPKAFQPRVDNRFPERFSRPVDIADYLREAKTSG